MATVYFTPRAETAPQIDDITVSGAWASGDDLTLRMYGADLVLTLGAAHTTAQVATAIIELVNGTTQTLANTSNTTGPQVPQFSVVSAAAHPTDSSKARITGNPNGEPHTITVSETTAGSGALAIATSQTASSPNDASIVDNWSTGAVPTTSDVVIIENTDEDLLWNLDTITDALTSLSVSSTFEGTIGLPDENSAGYPEERTKYLELNCPTIKIGEGEGDGSSLIKLDCSSNSVTMDVFSTGSADEDSGAVIWKGTGTNTLRVVGNSSVGIAPGLGESATIATLSVADNSTVYGGPGVGTITTVNLDDSATLTLDDANITTLNQRAGTLTFRGTGTLGTANCDGGTLNYRSNGTLTTLNLDGTTVDFSGDSRSKTVTTTNFTTGSLQNFRGRVTWTNGFAPSSDANSATIS